MADGDRRCHLSGRLRLRIGKLRSSEIMWTQCLMSAIWVVFVIDCIVSSFLVRRRVLWFVAALAVLHTEQNHPGDEEAEARHPSDDASALHERRGPAHAGELPDAAPGVLRPRRERLDL